ncbi:MAG: ATP-binding protein [Prolixibacteraceae bacterium]|nr:ATP-binding protein [Prolixibacteraceae bacterium]
MKGLEFRISKPENDFRMTGDKDKIKQIISNLVSNAIKFTEIGYIEIGYSILANSILFYVKDTGIGISKEYHEIIFERFRQVKLANTRKYGGNGLGLTIAKQLAERMGGEITLESEIDKGITFYFSILQE